MKLIDKAALISEIERRISILEDNSLGIFGILASNVLAKEYRDILSFIDTLEVKEVDLEKEVDLDFKRFSKEMETVFALPSSKTENTEEEPLNWEYAIAKHFYELGLKAKGE